MAVWCLVEDPSSMWQRDGFSAPAVFQCYLVWISQSIVLSREKLWRAALLALRGAMGISFVYHVGVVGMALRNSVVRPELSVQSRSLQFPGAILCGSYVV